MAVVVGFAFLGLVGGAGARVLVGRLRRGTTIAPPWCEAALGTLWSVSAWSWTTGRLPGEWLPLLLGLGWLAVAAGSVDLLRGRLPDALTFPALPVVLLLVVPLGPASVARACAGAVALFGIHLLVRRTAPSAMGAGDVKLAAPLGAALAAVSWSALVVWAVLAASGTAAWAVGLVVRARRRHTRAVTTPGGRDVTRHRGVGAATAVPHGPSMLAAAWLVVASGALGAAGATAWPA